MAVKKGEKKEGKPVKKTVGKASGITVKKNTPKPSPQKENASTNKQVEKQAKENEKQKANKQNEEIINSLRSKLSTKDQKLVFDATLKSEISGKANNAYKLVRAKSKYSGYSFGWVQFDLPGNNNENANNIVRAAINNIDDKEFEKIVKDKGFTVLDKDKKERALTKEDLINKVLKTKGMDIPEVEAFKSTISKELAEGKTKIDGKSKKLSSMIDELSVKHIEEVEAYAEKKVKNYKDPEMRQFAKIFVADIKNQFSTKVNKALGKYLNGEKVEMPDLKGVAIKANSSNPDLMDFLVFHHNTKYARGEKKSWDLMRRFNNILTSAMDDENLNNEKVRTFIKACLKDNKISVDSARFLIDKDGIASNFRDDKNTFMENVIKNKTFSNLISMGVEHYIGNDKIKDIDNKTAALFVALNQNTRGFEKDKKLREALLSREDNPSMSDLVSHYLKYAKNEKDEAVKENFIKVLKELKIEIKNEAKLRELLNSKEDDAVVDDFIKKNIMASGHCNAWNHLLTCRCGFGGSREEYV